MLDSTSIMELDELPEHLIILGGGYIGLEFGQMFRRFSSEVTIIRNAARLQILGCAVLGSEGGEIMSIIQVAMLG